MSIFPAFSLPVSALCVCSFPKVNESGEVYGLNSNRVLVVQHNTIHSPLTPLHSPLFHVSYIFIPFPCMSTWTLKTHNTVGEWKESTNYCLLTPLYHTLLSLSLSTLIESYGQTVQYLFTFDFFLHAHVPRRAYIYLPTNKVLVQSSREKVISLIIREDGE